LIEKKNNTFRSGTGFASLGSYLEPQLQTSNQSSKGDGFILTYGGGDGGRSFSINFECDEQDFNAGAPVSFFFFLEDDSFKKTMETKKFNYFSFNTIFRFIFKKNQDYIIISIGILLLLVEIKFQERIQTP